MAVKITCIKKANGDHENQYVAISSMSWINEYTEVTGTTTREDMYQFIYEGGEAYVEDAAGNKAQLVACISAKGNKYVKTEADSMTSDNLLKLKEC
ncbi:DUF3892 domain-containing protein [Mucilaginibacter sp. CAU 1740]|uniref:DUF3892 domain-containing protein n=1 Tax=Mucilaginibacter sp. CAU 1740 TaxID=3140365 RepID=UPI00325A4E9C